ncbi:hypothetical protein PHLH4_16880 [Pseudomonas sp. St316]|nr:hypothetical protein PHLH4_16880 [Pseudomonas sp. St316]
MSTTINATCDPLEEKLRTFVEGLLGGKVTAMQRLPRWRPAWNLELQREGETLQLHIRGERGGMSVHFRSYAGKRIFSLCSISKACRYRVSTVSAKIRRPS